MLTLWLMPDKETYLKIGQLIAELSSVHNTPRFEPHVTLISGITDDVETALLKTQKLAADNNVLKASLTGVEYLEYFYRCLFFRTDDSEDIFHLRNKAESLFEHSTVNPFIPHISFLYGSLPTFKKEAIIAELGDRFLGGFSLQSLRLVRTELGPENWELLGEFELVGGR
jgi:2'-5' RNA ligase